MNNNKKIAYNQKNSIFAKLKKVVIHFKIHVNEKVMPFFLFISCLFRM